MIIGFTYKCVSDNGDVAYRYYLYSSIFGGIEFHCFGYKFTPICAWKIKDKELKQKDKHA